MFKSKPANSKSLNKLRQKLIIALVLLIISISAVAILSPLSFSRVVLALTGNYSKVTGDKLTLTDWNNLDDDFLAKSGGTMSGILNMGGKAITNLLAPTAATDAANKSYVDTKVLTAPAGSGELKKYSMVISMNSTGSCPTGYTQELVSGLYGTNNYAYMRINKSGLVMGVSAGNNYGQEYLFAGFNRINGPDKFCWKTFDSTTRPYTSVFLFDTDNSANCPSGYTYLPQSQIAGNNTWSYLISNDAGMYIGYMNTWAYDSTSYENGYIQRHWHTGLVKGACFKVMGVSGDSTQNGVFPVFLGLKDSATCSTLGSDWKNYDVSTLGNAVYTYAQWNDNASVVGPMYSWGHGGENDAQVYFHDTHVNNLCFKFFSTTGKPHAQIRLLMTGSCPAGFQSVDGGQLTGWNATGYYQQTAYGMYAGGLYSWGRTAYYDGWMTNNWTSDVAKFCFKMD